VLGLAASDTPAGKKVRSKERTGNNDLKEGSFPESGKMFSSVDIDSI
jgi:hypothetical protein